MQEGLTYLYQIYESFLDLIFNRFELFEGVTIGWIIIAVMVFGIMITSILNLPKTTPGVKK